MKKFIGNLKNRKGSEDRAQVSNDGVSAGGPMVPPQGDSPEATVTREVIAFCESGAPGSQTAGEEYLHLPAIVDGAESSPSAAKEAALCVKRYFGKEHYQRGFAQYNAIMLTRILTDNPGRNYTQNFDKDFVATVKRLLRDSKDSSVQQILRETLDYFEAEKLASNDTLLPLLEMWRKEKGTAARIYPSSQVSRAAPYSAPRPRGLPPPGELAARIEEAKTTARLLLQTLQSTPSNELTSNELVTEFGSRAKAAQKSIQNYMNSENPQPDDDTMLTLIETNEQLNIAMSKHQRALLQARKGPSPQPQANMNSYAGAGQNVYNQSQANGTSYAGAGQNVYNQPQQYSSQPTNNGANFNRPNVALNSGFVPPPGPPPGSDMGSRPGEQLAANDYASNENPFTDDASYDRPQQNSYSLFGRSNNNNNMQASNQYANQSYAHQPDNAYSAPTQPRPTGYQPTQSYMNRQEDASQHITMHGASPPPGQTR